MILNTENLITGIDIIDEQHQALFNLINNLDEIRESKENFNRALLELQIYVSNHFKTEEEYMRYMSYPDLPNHKDCHDKFIEDYKALLKKLSSTENPLDLASEFIEFVETWIKEHYTNVDVKMAEYINSKSK